MNYNQDRLYFSYGFNMLLVVRSLTWLAIIFNFTSLNLTQASFISHNTTENDNQSEISKKIGKININAMICAETCHTSTIDNSNKNANQVLPSTSSSAITLGNAATNAINLDISDKEFSLGFSGCRANEKMSVTVHKPIKNYIYNKFASNSRLSYYASSGSNIKLLTQDEVNSDSDKDQFKVITDITGTAKSPIKAQYTVMPNSQDMQLKVPVIVSYI